MVLDDEDLPSPDSDAESLRCRRFIVRHGIQTDLPERGTGTPLKIPDTRGVGDLRLPHAESLSRGHAEIHCLPWYSGQHRTVCPFDDRRRGLLRLSVPSLHNGQLSLVDRAPGVRQPVGEDPVTVLRHD